MLHTNQLINEGRLEEAKASVLQLIKDPNSAISERLRALADLGDINRYQGNYKQSIVCFNDALILVDSIRKSPTLDHSNIFINIAKSELLLGNDGKAEALCNKASAILEDIKTNAALMNSSWRLVDTALIECKAQILRFRGQYHDALQCMKNAVRMTMFFQQRDVIQISCLLNNLGMIHKYMGRYRKAESCYSLALKLLSSSDGQNAPHIHNVYYNFGGLAHATDNPKASYRFAKKSLCLRNQVLGESHPDFAISLSLIAASLIQMKRFAIAEKLIRRSRDILFTQFGSIHRDIAMNLNHLGVINQSVGKIKLAITNFESAISMKKQCLGPHHPDLIAPALNLLFCYSLEQNDVLAKELSKFLVEYLKCNKAIIVKRNEYIIARISKCLGAGSQEFYELNELIR